MHIVNGEVFVTFWGVSRCIAARGSPLSLADPVGCEVPEVHSHNPSRSGMAEVAADIEPQAKLHACELVEAIAHVVCGRLRLSRYRVSDCSPRLVSQLLARPLSFFQCMRTTRWLESSNTQYGGILSDKASVCVAFRQWRVKGAVLTPGGADGQHPLSVGLISIDNHCTF